MSPELAYQFANILTISVLCGSAGLICGFGWGRESEQQAQAARVEAAEVARVNSFRLIFNEGVTRKKEQAPKGQLISQR